MKRLKLPLLFFAGLVSAVGHAEPISNPAKGYSFDLPPGWSIDRKQKDFTIRGGADLAIAELPAPPPPGRASLDFVSSMNQMAALATGSCGKMAEKDIALEGENWSGNAFLCDNPKTAKVAARQELTLTVKRGAEFYVFILTMPADAWSRQKQTYVPMLSSLRFR